MILKMNMKGVKTPPVIIILLISVYLVNCATLLSFGPGNENDMEAPGMTDDSNLEITAAVSLTFYGSDYTFLWLGSNGYIALQDTVAYANSIPSAQSLKLISPLFDDIRPSGSGKLYYRQTSDAADISAGSALVNDLFPEFDPYTATYVLVVTWSDYNKINQPGKLTFQAVVTTDGTNTFAVFLYQELTTGLTADVGIDAGDGTNFYKLCIGGTPDIQSLPLLKQTCNNEAGVFGFRIDSIIPDQDSYVCTASFSDEDCIACDDLENPANGTVDTSAGLQVGNVATYSCFEGYEPVGDTSRECLTNLTWSGTEPICQVSVVCEELTDPVYGTVDLSAGRKVGDVATYSCTGGYDLEGDITRECLADGIWNGSQPICRITASSYCSWNDVSHTLIDVTFITNLAGASRIAAVDTKKYEDGEDPSLNNTSCETEYTTDPTPLLFTIDPNVSTPACGVRITGTVVKTLEVTIRVYYDDVRFDVENDRIYQFSCTTDTILPRSQTQTKNFNDIEITSVPALSRSVRLMVITPEGDTGLSEVHMGQLIQLRIVYDNTANNVEPYGVYITECTVADTMSFDSSISNIIQNGCVVQQTPGALWYMTRSFEQTSLSPAGLFISDSGTLLAVRFVNSDKLFFRCKVDFCFFPQTAPNLCSRSCSIPGRKKRSQSASSPQSIYTSVKIVGPLESDTTGRQSKSCINNETAYIVLGIFGFLIFASLTLTFIVFFKLIHTRPKRAYRRRTR